MVFVHLPGDQINRVISLPGVWTRPTQIFRDARLADETSGDLDRLAVESSTIQIFFQFGGDAVMIGQPPAQVLLNLLGRFAGHFAQVAVHLNGGSGDSRFVAVRKGGFGDQISEQPFKNQKPVADEMVVGLLVNRCV